MDGYIIDKVLDKSKETKDIEKIDETKINYHMILLYYINDIRQKI